MVPHPAQVGFFPSPSVLDCADCVGLAADAGERSPPAAAAMASQHSQPADSGISNTAPRQPEHGTMQEKAAVVAEHDEKNGDHNSGSSDTRVNGASLALAVPPANWLSGNSAGHSEPTEDGDVCGGERGWRG